MTVLIGAGFLSPFRDDSFGDHHGPLEANANRTLQTYGVVARKPPQEQTEDRGENQCGEKKRARGVRKL